MKVFWSWQSDTPAKLNKDFVKAALQDAVAQVSEDLGFTEAERPTVDHDTKDEPGLVAIVETIFKKIEAAEVFVGDVTFVGATPDGKLLPNANVMIELGHALTSVGHHGIILVANKAFGGRPEDLPFDLRHRRGPITYELKEGTPKPEREAILRRLTKDLAQALRVNLGAAVTKRNAEVTYPLHPPRPDDRSTWLQVGESIRHLDSMAVGGESKWNVPEKTRSYMRIIPAAWPSKPSRDQVLKVPDPARVWALGPWSNGNYGANSHGVVYVGFFRDPNEAVGVTQWFSKTGEIWGFNNAAAFHGGDGMAYLSTSSILKEWRNFLRAGLGFLDHFGVSGPIRVEAGVVGMDDVYWPERMQGPCRAVEREVFLSRDSRTWHTDEQTGFLTDVFNQVLDAFGQPHTTSDSGLIFG